MLGMCKFWKDKGENRKEGEQVEVQNSTYEDKS